ncbi:DUF952 domain-containing protein [Streptomyces sp. NPDC055243]|uniref:DUF952 domain-containing protein n=1 Tax=Streptomyces sp. NPDC055243 TaxID=3365720 RepID=UPI0037D930BE
MIYHVVTLGDWLADSDGPYAPASLADEGFVHCSPDEETSLAVATAFHKDAAGPLMLLQVDEHKLGATVRWEAADPTPPPGVPGGTLFPHVFGPIDRTAVEGLLEIERDQEGRATRLVPRT